MEENYTIRELIVDDYYNGYLELLYEFTNFKYKVEFNDFISYLNDEKDYCKIMIITQNNNIIGAGSVFKIPNLLNENIIGLIEDIIINIDYRGLGLGKLLINKLKEYGISIFNCKQIILNCAEENIDFYNKCGFEEVGKECKIIIDN